MLAFRNKHRPDYLLVVQLHAEQIAVAPPRCLPQLQCVPSVYSVFTKSEQKFLAGSY